MVVADGPRAGWIRCSRNKRGHRGENSAASAGRTTGRTTAAATSAALAGSELDALAQQASSFTADAAAGRPQDDAHTLDAFERERAESEAACEREQHSSTKARDELSAVRDELRRVQDENIEGSQDPDPEQTRKEERLGDREKECAREYMAARFYASSRGIVGRKRRLLPEPTGGAPLTDDAGRENFTQECDERRHWRNFQQHIQAAIRGMYSLDADPHAAGGASAAAPAPRPFPDNEADFQKDLEASVLPWLQHNAPATVASRAAAVHREGSAGFNAIAPKAPSGAGRADFRADFNAETTVDYPHQDRAHPDTAFKVAFELKYGGLVSGQRHGLTGQVDGYLRRGYDMVVVVVLCTNGAVTPAVLGFSGNPRVAMCFISCPDMGQEPGQEPDADADEDNVPEPEEPIRPYSPVYIPGLEDPQADSVRTKMSFYPIFKVSPEWKQAYFEKERYIDRMSRAFLEHSANADLLRPLFKQTSNTGPPRWCTDLVVGAEPDVTDAAARSTLQQAFRRCTSLEEMTEIICGGQTQVGKTMFKTVGILVARQCDPRRKIASIVVTSSVPLARELALKIARQIQTLSGSPVAPVDVMTANQEIRLSEDGTLALAPKRTGELARIARRDMLRCGGVVVLANSMDQIGDIFF